LSFIKAAKILAGKDDEEEESVKTTSKCFYKVLTMYGSEAFTKQTLTTSGDEIYIFNFALFDIHDHRYLSAVEKKTIEMKQ
jgi:hypothetical protein